jgi:hypothetical protein
MKARAFLSVFVDRLSGLLVLLAIAAVATVACPVEMPLWVRGSVWSTVAGAIGGLSMLPWLARHPVFAKRLGPMGSDASRCLAMTLQPGPLFLSLFVQASNCVLVWLVGLSIGAKVPFAYYTIMVPMVSLMTMVPVSINGLGVREGGVVLFLAPLGVPQGVAVSIAFLWFCAFSAASLLGGLVYLFGRFPRPEVSTNESVGHHSDQGRARQRPAAA